MAPPDDGLAQQSNPLWRDKENEPEESQPEHLAEEEDDEPEEEEYYRMPVVALVACSFTVFVASFSIYNVFPYAGLMAIHFGKADDRDDAGYYAGWIAAGFMGGRTLTAFVWGAVADTHGRRFVLVAGCAGMAVFSLAFGLATTFEGAVLCRFAMGFFNGVVGTGKTVMSELVPAGRKDLQALAMSTLMGAVSFGGIIGPAVGGWLADPCGDSHQSTDSGGSDGSDDDGGGAGAGFCTPALRRFPFLLPNVLNATVALAACVLVVFFVPETRGAAAAAFSKPTAITTTTTTTTIPTTSNTSNTTAPTTVIPASAANYGKLAIDVDDDSTGGIGRSNGAGSSTAFIEDNGSSLINGNDNKEEGEEEAEAEGDADADAVGQQQLPAAGLPTWCGGVRGIVGRMAAVMRNGEALWAIGLYSMHSFAATMASESFPLWCLASAPAGLELTVGTIGTLLAGGAAMLLLFQATTYHRLAKRTTTVGLFALFCFLTGPALVSLVLGASSLSDDGDGDFGAAEAAVVAASDDDGRTTNSTALNATASGEYGGGDGGGSGAGRSSSSGGSNSNNNENLNLLLFVGVMYGIAAVLQMGAYTSTFLLINESCESAQRGAVNGAAQTAASFFKALGPAVGSVLFAVSVEHSTGRWWFDAHFTFYLLGIYWTALASWSLVHYRHPYGVRAEKCASQLAAAMASALALPQQRTPLSTKGRRAVVMDVGSDEPGEAEAEIELYDRRAV